MNVTTKLEGQPSHTFTLTFPGGKLAILQVRGAKDQEQARAAAATAFKGVEYGIFLGDQTNGKAEAFYLYVQPQEEERKPISDLTQEELDTLLAEAHGAVEFLTTLDVAVLSDQERAEYPATLQGWYRMRNLLQTEYLRRLVQQLDILRAKVKAAKAKAQGQEGGERQ